MIWDHHPGFIDKATYENNRERIAGNTRPRAHEPGGAVREGVALLQGIAVCARCGRKLKVHYQGKRGQQRPNYHCPASILVDGRGSRSMRVGGGQIDQAVTTRLGAGARIAVQQIPGTFAVLARDPRPDPFAAGHNRPAQAGASPGPRCPETRPGSSGAQQRGHLPPSIEALRRELAASDAVRAG